MPSRYKIAGRGVTAGPTPDWTNPGNITAEDDVFASISLSSTATLGDYIRADQFGFDIPTGATIDGIVAYPSIKASVAGVFLDYSVVMLKGGTPPAGGDDKKDTSNYWPTTETLRSYGGPTDLWNVSWAASDINASTFGFAVRPTYTSAYSSATAYVDYMAMLIYYTFDGMKMGTQSINKVYYGSTEIQKAYLGSTRVL